MAKDPRDRMKEQADKVTARYGKTTGQSAGSKPAPPGKIKVKPGKKTTRVTWEKKF